MDNFSNSGPLIYYLDVDPGVQAAFLQWYPWASNLIFRLKLGGASEHGETLMQQFWKQVYAISTVFVHNMQ